jgi:NTE family protein
MTILDQLEPKPGTALVLSGGATKAFFFHVGVLKVVQPTEVSAIVGSSAGAIAGALLASGTSIDDLIRVLDEHKIYLPDSDTWLTNLRSTMLFKPRYSNIVRQSAFTTYRTLRWLSSLPLIYKNDVVAEFLDVLTNSQSKVSGFFSAVALEDLLQSVLPSLDFRDLKTDLYVVATDIDNHRRAVFNPHYTMMDDDNHFMCDVPLQRAVRASASIPGVFDPVMIKGRHYVDGEIKRTLSADIGMSLADRVIVSHTYQPLNLPENQTLVDKGWLSVVKQSAYIVFHERIRVWERIYRERYPDKEIICIQPEHDDEVFFDAPQFSFRPEVQKALIHSGEMAARHTLDRLAQA